MDETVDRAGEGVLVVDDDWTVSDANARAGALLEVDPVGAAIDRLLTDAVTSRLRELREETAENPAAGEADATQTRTDTVTHEAFFPAQERWFEVRGVLGEGSLYVYLYDVTEWARREQELARSQDELTLLNRLNALIQDLFGALVGATSREEIETTIVERLVETDVFDLAWIAIETPGADTLEISQIAGEHRDLVESLLAPEAPSLERAAIGDQDLVVETELAKSEAVPDAVRRAAFAHGIQGAAAVPLTYGDSVFGALGLYTPRPAILDESGRAGLATLGEGGGFAINASRNRQAMRSATRRELEFSFRGTDDVLASIATGDDVDVSVTGTAQPDPDRLLVYVSVTAEDSTALVEAAREHDTVGHCRVITDHEEGAILEFGLGEGSPLLHLVNHGGSIVAATATEGTSVVTVHVAPSADVRDIVDGLTARFETASLLAKRTTEALEEGAADLTSVFAEDLTDRQRIALQTAYNGGYFESPRESTAEDLAESIGVSSPTFHHHLRAAQRKLLDALLGEEDRL